MQDSGPPFVCVGVHVVSFLDALLAQLLGVTATCALELGVDIGELDVTLHLGFPGEKLWREAFVLCSFPWWLFTISIPPGERRIGLFLCNPSSF